MSIASILESAVLSEGNLYINASPEAAETDMTLRFNGESVALALLSDADMHPVDLPFSAAFVYPVHGAEIEEHLLDGTRVEFGTEAYENVMPDWALGERAHAADADRRLFRKPHHLDQRDRHDACDRGGLGVRSLCRNASLRRRPDRSGSRRWMVAMP